MQILHEENLRFIILLQDPTMSLNLNNIYIMQAITEAAV